MRAFCWAAIALCAALFVERAHAQMSAPVISQRADLADRLGQSVPTELSFFDVDGQSQRLARYLGGKPGVLVLAYARCTLLCNVVLQALANAVAGLSELAPGSDYRLVLVSIDPEEPSREAASKQQRLLANIGYPGARWRFPYLRGDEKSVASLAAAVGFRYAWDEGTKQYVHPAVVFVLTPEGRVSQHLYGLEFGAAELRRALETAAQSAIGEKDSADILRCFRFDPGARRYREAISLYFRIGGGLIFLALVAMIVGLVRWERRRT